MAVIIRRQEEKKLRIRARLGSLGSASMSESEEDEEAELIGQ